MEKIYGVRCHVCGIDKNSSYLLAYIRNDQPSSGVAIYFCPFFLLSQTAVSFWLYNGFQPGNKGWKKNLLFDRFNPLLGESKAIETAVVNRNVGKSPARK